MSGTWIEWEPNRFLYFVDNECRGLAEGQLREYRAGRLQSISTRAVALDEDHWEIAHSNCCGAVYPREAPAWLAGMVPPARAFVEQEVADHDEVWHSEPSLVPFLPAWPAELWQATRTADFLDSEVGGHIDGSTS